MCTKSAASAAARNRPSGEKRRDRMAAISPTSVHSDSLGILMSQTLVVVSCKEQIF